ncbi:heteromeric transposase endonuclease subunit TnsA [Clostridium formicaceticum]|uniref:Transposase n=1 Tax=Clostridium formicaceticum TaxID=1497 RepID=A0AAC9WKU2_9CLOT|nr:heteromeric transposase endonuclease subunit TnsA [Clostridium formicaceticum]AOY75365.1 transposase [Clostridium formicaceticum]ARE89820.1 Transposon Tn7 transposition protein TnsA [Clostridium formicaceticum]
MAKRKLVWNENKIKEFIKEGRGSGEGENYKPWLNTQDFPSMGMTTRTFSKKTNRMHHFFSNTQLHYFYLLEWEDAVLDIREHYPLLDLEEVLKDTSDLKLNKFQNKENGTSYIFATSFLITLLDKDGNTRSIARSIKYASELSKSITQEKLEIERRYWQEGKGIDWGIVTNKDINIVRAKNIEWIRSIIDSSEYLGFSKSDVEGLIEGLLYRLVESKGIIRDIIFGYEQDYDIDKGSGLLLFKYMIANKIVKIDMDKPINLKNNSSTLIFPQFKKEGVVNL